MTLGVVIRFRNSASTLERTLAGLAAQTRLPDLIVGVDNDSSDDSRHILEEHGATFVDWRAPYHVSRVLNHALRACNTDLVVVLSSHSVLLEHDTLARYERSFDDENVAAACHRHRGLARYSDVVDLEQVKRCGMSRGSFYSNSVGCLRRRFWEEIPFDERIDFAAEDYHWALSQLERGRVVRLLRFRHEHNRPTTPSQIFLKTSRAVRAIGRQHGLRIAYLGPGGDLHEALHAAYWCAKSWGRDPMARRNLRAELEWIRGALDWRKHDPFEI